MCKTMIVTEFLAVCENSHQGHFISHHRFGIPYAAGESNVHSPIIVLALILEMRINTPRPQYPIVEIRIGIIGVKDLPACFILDNLYCHISCSRSRTFHFIYNCMLPCRRGINRAIECLSVICYSFIRRVPQLPPLLDGFLYLSSKS